MHTAFKIIAFIVTVIGKFLSVLLPLLMPDLGIRFVCPERTLLSILLLNGEV
jgi:hypothetical protein